MKTNLTLYFLAKNVECDMSEIYNDRNDYIIPIHELCMIHDYY